MTLRDIALLNLRRRKAKAAFVLGGLTLGVATMVALLSLANTLTHQINHRLEKYGANILITPQADQLSLSYEGLNLGGFVYQAQELKQEELGAVAHIKNAGNIAAIGPMVLGGAELSLPGQPPRQALLAGVDFQAASILKPWWKLEGELPGDGQLLAGSEAARLLGLAPGAQALLGGRGLRVSGVLAPTGSQDDSLLFMPLTAAQELLGKPGLVSMVEVAALCKDCPVDDMVLQISQALPGAKVTAIQSVVKGRLETAKAFANFSLGVSGLVALLASLLVLVTMMASVKERTNEIGVLAAIGFRRAHIMRVVLWEALLLSLAAGLLGYSAGLGVGQAALPFFGEGHGASLGLHPRLGLAALGLSLILGLGASFYPAWLAARLDPSTALRTL